MKLFMQRCPKCEMENWAPAVATGCCAWCAYKATEADIGRNVWVAKEKEEK